MILDSQPSLQSWIDPRVEVRCSSIEGKGMFASEPILAGELVVVWGGTLFTEAEIRDGKAKPGSAAMIAEGLYLADALDEPDSPDYFLNHSCDPNLWMQDERSLVSRRDISPREELVADYALWESDPGWVLEPCRCGATCCRGRITGNDWQRPDLQARYKEHFIPFLNLRLEKDKIES